jgi:hypothetical protein
MRIASASPIAVFVGLQACAGHSGTASTSPGNLGTPPASPASAEAGAQVTSSTRRINYGWIAPQKLQKRLGPGTLDLTVDAEGNVTGSFSPGGIAGPGGSDGRAAAFALPIDPRRAERLWMLLDDARFESLPRETSFEMGEGQPIEVGRGDNESETRATFSQTKIPPALEPFLAEVRALANELVDHPTR